MRFAALRFAAECATAWQANLVSSLTDSSRHCAEMSSAAGTGQCKKRGWEKFQPRFVSQKRMRLRVQNSQKHTKRSRMANCNVRPMTGNYAHNCVSCKDIRINHQVGCAVVERSDENVLPVAEEDT